MDELRRLAGVRASKSNSGSSYKTSYSADEKKNGGLSALQSLAGVKDYQPKQQTDSPQQKRSTPRNYRATNSTPTTLKTIAKKSVVAYDESGRPNAWQTALNLINDAKSYANARTAKQDTTGEEDEEAARKRGSNIQLDGVDYEVEEMPFMSSLLGHPVYKRAKDIPLAQVHGLEEGAGFGEIAAKAASDWQADAGRVREQLSTSTVTGDPAIDNWGKTMRVNANAAQIIAQTYGIPTYALDGSLTQQTTDDYIEDYKSKSFGQKLGSNVGITAANYGLDIANAGLVAADTLTGGRLGKGSGTASSVFKIANFMQNAGSGLTAQAYSSMRESTNWLGKFVLDIERTGVEQTLDRIVGMGNGLVPMGIRVFGSGAQESENRGEGLGKQITTGLGRGAVEIGTEMLGGIGGSWRGTGYGDSFFNAVDKWVAGKTGSEILGTLAHAFGSEATEEMLADVLNPLMDRILGIGEATGRGQDRSFMQKVGDFLTDVWGDGQLLYDGLLGGIAGMGGGVETHVMNSMGAKNLAVDVATYKAAQRITGDNALKAKFEEMTGVELAEDDQTAIMQTAMYLTNVSESTEGKPTARQIENDLIKGSGTFEKAAKPETPAQTETSAESAALGDEEGGPVTLDSAAEKYGRQRGAFKQNYNEGQDIERYADAFDYAWNVGKGGGKLESVKNSATTAYLTDAQKEYAWRVGAIAAWVSAGERAEAIKANGLTGKTKGTVRAEGATLSEIRSAFNDKQNLAYKTLKFAADATGIDIVLYRSKANADGVFTDAQGMYKRSTPGTIYIDVNAGLRNVKGASDLSNYTMLRTFSHEFTHFVENWNPENYNGFRQLVLDTIDANGQSAHDMIESKMAEDSHLDYDGASREVVAEAMTDMMQDSTFLQQLAGRDKSTFEKLREKFEEFLASIKEYFRGLKADTKEARALKEQVGESMHYMQSIVDAFDKVAVEAVENYNAAQVVSGDEKSTATEDGVQYQLIGEREDGIEVYETSEEVKRLPWKQKKQRFMALMMNEYRGRTAKFVRNGHAYYAKFEETDLQKNIYGDHDSDLSGRDAKINTGADGSIFNLVENSAWFGSQIESGKGGKAHKSVKYWDYYIKTVQIDGKIFDLLANVRRKANEEFTYNIELYERNDIEAASPPSSSNEERKLGVPTASETSITEIEEENKGEKQVQFQMREPVEETTRMVAVHNKSVSGLRRMLQRGGVPFPSIAIKKAGSLHEGFGDVSIVFPRSSIDPEESRNNRLYSNDAWTPTEPRTEYDVGDMWRYTKKLRKEVGDDVYDGLSGSSDMSEEEVAKNLMSSEGNIFEALKNVPVLKYAYLQSIGKAPKTQNEETELDVFGKYKNEQLLAVFDAISGEEIENMDYDSTETLQKIADVLMEQFLSRFDSEQRKKLRRLPVYTAEKINPYAIKDAYRKYTANGGIESAPDYYALKDELRRNKDILTDDRYKTWIENRFSDLIKDSGIPNGKDLYTDSGNMRSFKARHVPATMENIVQQMRKEQERGIGTLGDINLKGAATKTYSSVEEMRADSGRLLGTHISDEDYDSYMEEYFGRLYELTKRGALDSENWSSRDTAEKIMLEAIRDAKSKKAMGTMLRKQAKWFKYSPKLVDDLWELRNDVQNMPAPYFEAKPRRIVYPEEALAYILPDNADSDVVETLNSKGYNVLTYKAGDEQDRLRKLNSVEGAQFQRRETTLSDREVLELAAEEIEVDDLTDGEKYWLGEFQNRLAKQAALEEQREELGSLYYEQQFGSKDYAEAKKTLARMKILDMQIEKQKTEVLKVEDSKVLKQVLEKARKVAEEKEREKGEKNLKKYRNKRAEAAEVKKYREQVEKKAKKLSDMLLTNSNDVHVPEVLKAPLAEFLTSIDYSSKQRLRGGEDTQADQKLGVRMMRLQQLLENQQKYINGTGDIKEDLGGYIDVSPESMEYLRNMSETITQELNEGRDFTINRMSADQLHGLSTFLSTITTGIRNMNRFMANERFSDVSEAAKGDMAHMEEMGKASTVSHSAGARFLQWMNGLPYYVMKRFGEGGQAIFDGLAKGWEKMAFNAQEVIQFTKELYSPKEVNAWKRKLHEITLSDGSKITMTTAQIMELSQLLGREQAVRHIERGGIRIGDIEQKVGKIVDATKYHLTAEDIATITGLLTERQIKVAKSLQRFMAFKGAEWGNEVSMRRFGYRFYAEGEAYYPIRTDANDRAMQDTDAQVNSMFRLLNLSSSKSLNPKASNALIVGDIFDTFADHMADMAKLNGMGLPILDAIKWFNYKERIDREDGTHTDRTLQAAMNQAFGSEAQHYFRTLIKDINGVNESGDRGTEWFGKMMSNYKIAAVGANLRVVLLQPTSYVRAQTVIKPKYLGKAFFHKNAYKEAMQYSGTAVWKSLGYYDTNISRNMREQIQHDETFRDKVVDAAMKGAEIADQRTWGRLWVACKMQTKAENPTLEGEALKQATAELFRHAIYSSQVMDSTLTRSEMMRGTTMATKAATSFMAEPTLSYNILLDAESQYEIDTRRFGKSEAWRRNRKKIGKAFAVYISSQTFAAVVESIADAARDDDDEKYWEKFKQAFLGEDSLLDGNLIQDIGLLGKIPYFKDIVSIFQGYTNSNMSMQAFADIFNVFGIWKETIALATGKQDKPTELTWNGTMTPWGKIYKTLQPISRISGYPAANLTRDVVAIWNNIVDGRVDDWKLRTYESAADRRERETYKEFIKPLGVSREAYSEIVAQADVNGNGNVTQDELGAILQERLKAGEISKAQAVGIWNSNGWKTSFDKWSDKQ